MKLSDWAKTQGISYTTAYRWFKTDKLPVKSSQTLSGTILVEENLTVEDSKEAWIYCRVSSYAQKDNLTRQVERCQEFCINNGWEIKKTVKEIASGMNDKRPKLLKLLTSKPTRIVVEYKDRLTRFGFAYFEIMLPMIGCKLIVINRDSEDNQDLMKDLVSIITSFCCRIYGLRRGKTKSKKLTEELSVEAT